MTLYWWNHWFWITLINVIVTSPNILVETFSFKNPLPKTFNNTKEDDIKNNIKISTDHPINIMEDLKVNEQIDKTLLNEEIKTVDNGSNFETISGTILPFSSDNNIKRKQDKKSKLYSKEKSSDTEISLKEEKLFSSKLVNKSEKLQSESLEIVSLNKNISNRNNSVNSMNDDVHYLSTQSPLQIILQGTLETVSNINSLIKNSTTTESSLNNDPPNILMNIKNEMQINLNIDKESDGFIKNNQTTNSSTMEETSTTNGPLHITTVLHRVSELHNNYEFNQEKSTTKNEDVFEKNESVLENSMKLNNKDLERVRKSKGLLLDYKNSFIHNYSFNPKNELVRSTGFKNEYSDERKKINDSEGNISSEALQVKHAYFMDPGTISGVCLCVFAVCCAVGTFGITLYKRNLINKPQALSEPDSSVYIDDSTVRDNSDEMYSLDNDSFLNSLEAMTIQNYWTETVKHTKL